MRTRLYSVALATAFVSSSAAAQAPVAAAFRDFASTEAKNLLAAAKDIPADKYSYKPTPATDAWFQGTRLTGMEPLVTISRSRLAGRAGYKPTPAQMSVGDIVQHLNQGNDFLCGTIAGTKAPTRAKLTGASPKKDLVAMLEDTFEFCTKSLAGVDDSKLTEELPMFGGRKMSRAAVMTLTTGDWADHYSQLAIYMRLNGMLPPTAKKPE